MSITSDDLTCVHNYLLLQTPCSLHDKIPMRLYRYTTEQLHTMHLVYMKTDIVLAFMYVFVQPNG